MLCSILFGSQQQRILTAGIMGVFVEDFEGDAALGRLDFHADVLFRAEDGEELTAYVPLKESTGGGFPGFPGFPGGGESTTTVESVIDLDTVQKYYNVPDSLV